MLYPGSIRPATAPPKVTVTTSSGETITGSLVSRDEFTITVEDSARSMRTWAALDVKFTIHDGMNAHFEQLGKYSDEDMHNVYAYLQTLRQ